MKYFVVILSVVCLSLTIMFFLFLDDHIVRKDDFTLDQSIMYKFDNSVINKAREPYNPDYLPDSKVMTASVSYAGTSVLLNYDFYLLFTIVNNEGVEIPVFPSELIIDSNSGDFDIKVDLIGVFYASSEPVEVIVLSDLEFTGKFALSLWSEIPVGNDFVSAPAGHYFPRIALNDEEYTLTCVVDVAMFANLFGGSYEILRLSRPIIWEDDGYQFGDVLEALTSIFVAYPSWILKHVNLPIELLGGFI